MRNATRVTVSTYGALAGLMGVEHGIGEMLQGNIAPDGIVISSWPGSALFRILAGEPAMTIVPSFFVTGILAILFSLAFLVWATLLVQRKNSGLVLILLSIVMLLVGAGFGPPFLGIIVGVTGTRINAPLAGRRARFFAGSRRFLGGLWLWGFITSLVAWLLLFPGSILLDYFFGVGNPKLIVPIFFTSALGLLLLTILAGFAHDSQRLARSLQSSSLMSARPVSQVGS